MIDEYDPQADALDAYLSSGRNTLTPNGNHPSRPISGSEPPLPLEEAKLASELKRLAQNIQPDPGFEKDLEQRLSRNALRRNPPSDRRTGLGCWIAWSGLAVALLVGLIWIVRNLLPTGVVPAVTQPVVPAVSTERSTPPTADVKPTAALTATPLPLATPTTSGAIYSLPIQPDVDFLLETEFPQSPSEIGVYRQIPRDELTVENAEAGAAQIGVNGEVYIAPYGSLGNSSYLVWDGAQKVIFYGSPASFQYESGNPALYEVPGCEAPCLAAGTEDTLRTFLNEHGLMGFSAETRLSAARPQVEQLVQMVEGFPLLYRPGEYQGEGLISSQGEVLRLDYNPANLESLGSYPILTAEQAWEAATRIDAERGIEVGSRSAPSKDFQVWLRAYPAGEPVEIFGNLSVFQSAAGGSPLILLENMPLAGNIEGMERVASTNPFLQIWGIIQEDNAGRRALQVDGWQLSAFPFQTLSGRIERQGNQTYLNTGDRAYLLADLPDGVPDDQIMAVSGVVLEQPELTLSWSSITSDSGGGGGGGGGAFPELKLEGDGVISSPASEPSATPPLAGQRLEGARGQPFVMIRQFSDGSTEAEVWFTLDPQAEGQEPTAIMLEGPGLAGIEDYHNLPLYIWGSFDDAQGDRPSFSLERYEPVYPDVKIQAWLGRYEPATLEDRQVLLFTTQEDEQYVLSFSIEEPDKQLEFSPGDPIVIEGLLLPDTDFGGYPVIQPTSILPGQGILDLSEHTVWSGKPSVIQESGTAGAAKKAFVRNIELAYYTQDMRFTAASSGSPLPFVQPVWRFSGTYEDGTLFEILIQALASEYLAVP